jgi:ubiquinone/menaquinone biosynthesis C-methylase UbiE
MGYVFDFEDARTYSRWASEQRNQWAAAMEEELMVSLLKPSRGESVLNIGCGTGASTLPLLQMGLNVTGIDPSPYMLDICRITLNNRVDYFRGFAEDLPFDDNSFNHAFFFLSLEFVDNPAKALEEACRVAKDKVFIGFLNRYAIKGVKRRVKGLFTDTIYNHARFFSIWELKKLVHRIAGPVPVSWRTICQLPGSSFKVMRKIEESQLVRRCPFGAFGGIVITLMPRLRTRPLVLRSTVKKSRPLVAGSAHTISIPLHRRNSEKDPAQGCSGRECLKKKRVTTDDSLSLPICGRQPRTLPVVQPSLCD